MRGILQGAFLTERLVVDKGPRQRRIEGWLYLILPPLIGATCRITLGRGAWQIPAILVMFVVMSIAGNAIALRLGGELISPRERWRRNLERLAAQSRFSLLFWTFLFGLLLLSGLNAPMIRQPPSREEIYFVFGVVVVGAATCSGLCVFFIRKQIAAFKNGIQADVPPETPWSWLAKTSPTNIISVGCIAVGYAIAGKFVGVTALVVVLAAAWVGLIVQSLIRSRLSKGSPILWQNFSLAAAIAAGVSLYGLFFAAFFPAMVLSQAPAEAPHRTRILVALVAGCGGFVVGILFALIPWAIARLNTIKPRA